MSVISPTLTPNILPHSWSFPLHSIPRLTFLRAFLLPFCLPLSGLLSTFGRLLPTHFSVICSKYSAFCAAGNCSFVCPNTSGRAAQKPNPPSAIANAGSFNPRFLRSDSNSFQLSFDSQNPCLSPSRCFSPNSSIPLITNKHAFSNAIPADK
jgi:hypothetical protein